MFLFVQSFLFAQYFVFIFQPKKQYWLYFAPQQLNFTTPLPFSPFIRSSSIRQSRSARAQFSSKMRARDFVRRFSFAILAFARIDRFLDEPDFEEWNAVRNISRRRKNYNCFSCDRIFRRCSCFDFHLSMQKDEVLYLQEMMLNLVTLYGLNT